MLSVQKDPQTMLSVPSSKAIQTQYKSFTKTHITDLFFCSKEPHSRNTVRQQCTFYTSDKIYLRWNIFGDIFFFLSQSIYMATDIDLCVYVISVVPRFFCKCFVRILKVLYVFFTWNVTQCTFKGLAHPQNENSVINYSPSCPSIKSIHPNI